jgi:saccharopine dehydrogenase-like NADP-dependent oxidoreductase
LTTALVVGLGEVGIRAARQLIDTPGVERVIVAARRLEHARDVASALHDGAEPYQLGRDDPLPTDLDAVVTALPGEADASLARRAVAAGIPYASAADRDATLRSLLALDVEAKAHATRVVAGCGLAPGLTDVPPATRSGRSTRSTNSTSRAGVSPAASRPPRPAARSGRKHANGATASSCTRSTGAPS